jgi:hypothetical protein
MKSHRDSDDGLRVDTALEKTLKDFRSSVHAWSGAEYSQPHKPVKVYATSWRLTVGWALGCVLAVGSLSGGLYERHLLRDKAKIARAAEAARQQKIEADQRKESEDLLAKIDGDVSREVPSAMEPLAQMMVDDSTQ